MVMQVWFAWSSGYFQSWVGIIAKKVITISTEHPKISANIKVAGLLAVEVQF